MSEEEANQVYKILEPIAMARPLFLDLMLSMRTHVVADKRTLKKKTNQSALLRRILEQVDPKSTVLTKLKFARG